VANYIGIIKHMTNSKLYCNDTSKSFYSHKTPEATKVGVMNYVMTTWALISKEK